MKKPQIIKTVSLFILSLCMLGLAGCSSRQHGSIDKEGNLKGTITVSGAFALYPMTVKWAEEFMKLHPGTRIDISAGGAGKGMTDALSGLVDLGMFSREVSPAEMEKGAWYIAVTKDAVLPTINADNPQLKKLMTHGLKRDIFKELFLNSQAHYWEEYFTGEKESRINVYTRSDACGAAEMWGKYLGGNQEALEGIGVFGDPGMADAIKNDRNGLGYNNVVYVYDMKTRMKYEGMEIIPVDLNGNNIVDQEENFYGTLDSMMSAIQSGQYPSPPARELYFVAKGQPTDPLVVAFIEWILKEGQQYVDEAGYVTLSDDRITMELSKLLQ